MKHSVSGDSMTEVLEPKVVIPCPVNYATVLQKLYIDLCNLIVESRIPRFNEKGYGDGIHCPPLLGQNIHGCDLSKPECQKHQRLVQHLLRAVGNNVLEIEVLFLPDCCTESKLKERIQNREYRLLEKWSMKCIYSKVQSPLVDLPQLLRAVRSFLHFSQLSAWLSSTNGKSPSNVYYWVKSNSDGLSTKFELEPEEHSFPVCKITDDLYGSVKVKYPPRTQYIPIIPCSKHPPLHGYPFRTIGDNPSLHQNISLNSPAVRQLHKPPCDDQIRVLTEKDCVLEATPVLIAPTILKTFTGNISDGNRVLNQSFCPDDLVDSSNLPFDLKQSKNLDLLSKSQTSYLCNYVETYSNGLSQENVCFDTSRLIRHFRKKRLKMKRININPFLSLANTTCLKSSDDDTFLQSQRKHVAENVSLNVGHPTSNSNVLTVPSTNTVEKKYKASLETETYHRRQLEQRKRPSKRKVLNSYPEKSNAIPPKKVCCDKYLSQGYQISLACLNEIFPQQSSESSQESSNGAVISTSLNLKNENGYLEERRIQALQSTISREADGHPSKCFSRSSIETDAKNERANQKNCRKRKLMTKLTVEEENVDADNETNYSYETEACSTTSVADLDDKNDLKNVKLMDDCGDNFSFLASHCTFHFDTPVYKSENKYVCEKRLLRSRSLDLLKYQIPPSSNSKLFHLDKPPNNVQNFSSSFKMESKSSVLSQRNELQTSLTNENNTSKSKLLSIRREKNRRLEAKLLKRYSKIFAAKCLFNSSETTTVDSNLECKSCSRTHLNSLKCGLREKKLNTLAKKIRKIKTKLKGLREEAIALNISEAVESKSLEINLNRTDNKSQLTTKNSKYKSSKKLFKLNSGNPSSSSQTYKIKDSNETLCASESCQCQESQPKCQLSERISVISTVPSAPETSLDLSSETETNSSIPHGFQMGKTLEPKEITLQNNRQCPFVLNRLVPYNKRSIT